MDRRQFLKTAAASAASASLFPTAANADSTVQRQQRYCRTSFGDIACREQGTGPAALFLHGWPLNSYHWRGALSRLSTLRHCFAPDLMGLGNSQILIDADLSPMAQVAMLIEFMDAVGIERADLVSNDSATTIAQLLAAHHGERVRSLLITNGDVHTNSPPPPLMPAIEQAREGKLIHWFERQLEDVEFAQSPEGLGGLTYTNPSFLTADLLEAYLRPLVSSPARRIQCQQYGVAFLPNPLPSIEQSLRRSNIPARMVWGAGDQLFPVEWANWLDDRLPGSRGVRLVQRAKLFFPEEFPDLIADEARRLWKRTQPNQFD